MISNSFTTHLALINYTQGNKESIHEFCSSFKGYLSALSQSSVAIPPILHVMPFLWGIHLRYQDLLSQFASMHKDLSHATIDSVVADAHYIEKFVVVGSKNKPPASSPFPCSPSAALVATNKEGKEFCSPWEWLVMYNSAVVVSWWHCSLTRGFYCTCCNSNEKHHPHNCPLLNDLGLKIIEVGGQGGGTMLGSSLDGTPASNASGGGKPASSSPPVALPVAVGSPPASTSSSPTAHLGAAVEADAGGKESLTDSFLWYGDKDGVKYKSNGTVSNYSPSCSQVLVESFAPHASHTGLVLHCCQSTSETVTDNIVLPLVLVATLLQAISPEDLKQLVMVDTGTTNHMLPECATFISYKSFWHLWVQMGNNSFALVLGQRTTIISLNGKHFLICNVLHVPALWVPLYSLRAHLRQRGCSFVGSHDTGIHGYFLGVVLSVDMSTERVSW